MSLSDDANIKINKLIDAVVNKYISRSENAPKANSGNPFVMALIKDFEPLIHRIHGLKTSLGTEMEKIAEIIAIDTWGEDNIKRKLRLNLVLPVKIIQTIDSIINNLNNSRTLSDYEKEKDEIYKACKKQSINNASITTEFDIVLINPTEKQLTILEMKGPDPNTTEVPGAKKRLLFALAWGYFHEKFDNVDSRLAIYYNNKFPNPYRNPKVHYYFNPNGGTLVQEDFWNFLGNSVDTFKDLTKLFEVYGEMNKKKIWDGLSKLINL